MPIVSNRGSVGTTRVSANENYTDRDYGRILYESALNDDIVFKAAIARDFKEVSARNEGTMLESELSVFSEFSAKEAWRSLKEKLKKIWEKIKAIFKSAFAKITTWIVRDGKAFVKLHRRRIQSNKDIGKCEIPKFRKPTGLSSGLDSASTTLKTVGTKTEVELLKKITGGKDDRDDDGKISSEKVCNNLLRKVVTSGEVTASDFKEKFMDLCFDEERTDVEFKNLGTDLSYFFSTLEGGKDHLKKLKKANVDADKAMAANIKAVSKAESKHNGQDTSKMKENEAEKHKSAGDIFTRTSSILSGQSSAITAISKAIIDAVRFDIKQCRMVVGKLAGFTYHEGALLETMAWLEGADEFDAMDDMGEDETVEGADIDSDADVDDLGDDED